MTIDFEQGTVRQTEVAEATVVAGQARTVDVTIIRPGESKNGMVYSEEVLRASLQMWEGATAFCDHPNLLDASRKGRSVRDVVGVYTRPRWDGAVKAHLRLLDEELFRLVEAIIRDRAKGLAVPNVGISADMVVTRRPIGENRWEVGQILAVNSADVVFDPAAGGGFDRILEAVAKNKEANVSDNVETRTTEQAPAQEAKAPDPAPAAVAEGSPLAAGGADAVASVAEARKALCGDLLALRLAASGLPEKARESVAKKFAGRVFESGELDKEIADMKVLLADLTQGHVIKGVGGERVQMGLSSREKMAYALDRLFELPIPDSAKNLPALSGIREAYILITGDTGLRGFGYGDWEKSVIAREANEVTTTAMNDLLGNVLNKRLTKDYEDQPKWWKKIVTETTIRDMKAQTRVLLGDFAVLPTVAENGAYANLAWSDTKETWTPVKKGSLVTVTMEAILNDDVRGITRIPRKLARAAAITMNEFIANLFTSNPTMADGFTVFDATNHQGNSGTTALSATALMSAMVVLAKMTDVASKRLGIRGRYVLIPPDLEETAYTACYSSLKPGTADNDKNILEGRADYTIVPQFTDTNDWYLVADPAEIECIEIGYLNGQRTPELLVQDDPTAGAVFTNDAIAYKVRWIFGGAWLDYRGAYRSVVA